MTAKRAALTVECTNADSMRLRVCAEMSLGEWKNIVTAVKDLPYYAPLAELRLSVEEGIKGIEDREVVRGQS